MEYSLVQLEEKLERKKKFAHPETIKWYERKIKKVRAEVALLEELL